MLNANRLSVKWLMVSAALGLFAALSVPTFGQGTPAGFPLSQGTVHDWTHHRLTFSNPETEAEALAHGTYSRWLKVVNDPRYALQQARRTSGFKTLDESSVGRDLWGDRGARGHGGKGGGGSTTSSALKLDWDEPLLTGGQIQPNMYPAKYSFSTTTASCTNDFVVFPTGVLGSNTTATIFANNELYGTATTGCSTTVPSVYWAFNTGAGTVTTSPVLYLDGSKVAFLQYNGTTTSLVVLKWHAGSSGAAGATLTGSLSATSPNVTLTVGTFTPDDVGATITGTGIPGGDTISAVLSSTTATLTTAPTAHAAETLTTTFTGSLSATSPNVTLTSGNFSANDVGAQITGTGIPAGDTISAVLSATTATLTAAPTAHAAEALVIDAEALATPGVPATSTNISGCTAPCMTVTNLGAAVPVTNSALYYDYTSDDAFVGDDNGNLYRITGVFNSTSSPVVSAALSLNALGYNIAPPVYDATSGCVFVGDSQGFVYSVSSGITGGSVCTSGTFGTFGHSAVLGNGAANDGIFDAPLVDSTAGKVYFFVTSAKVMGNCSTAGENCVAQFATNTITSGATLTAPFNEEPIGTGAATYNLYDGDFDNVYFSSTGGTAGHLWAMGNSGAPGGNLYEIPIGAGSAMSTPVAEITGLTDTTANHYAWASPITEYCLQTNTATPCGETAGATTGGTDYIYFSVDRLNATSSNCTAASTDGCLLGYNVSNISTFSTTPVADSQFTTIASPGCWVTGGIVIDNSVPSSTLVGAEQLYVMALNGNGAGGPSAGTYTSAGCTGNVDTAIPQAYQESQTLP